MNIELNTISEFPKVIAAFAPIPYGGYSHDNIDFGTELTKFKGNQHTEDWVWDEIKLNNLTTSDKRLLCNYVLEP